MFSAIYKRIDKTSEEKKDGGHSNAMCACADRSKENADEVDFVRKSKLKQRTKLITEIPEGKVTLLQTYT